MRKRSGPWLHREGKHQRLSLVSASSSHGARGSASSTVGNQGDRAPEIASHDAHAMGHTDIAKTTFQCALNLKVSNSGRAIVVDIADATPFFAIH